MEEQEEDIKDTFGGNENICVLLRVLVTLLYQLSTFIELYA